MRSALNSQDDVSVRGLLRELGREARRYRFEVAPNPCVGAAVLAEGREVARGFHPYWGGPHAEVVALEAAARSEAPRAQQDTLVITLEPCSSTGKTGPCVDRILAAGVRRVLVGAADPDPRHRGRGLELLQGGGAEVLFVPGSATLEEVSPHFLRWNSPERLRRRRPWTIAKWAQTLTGQLQPPADSGDGRWISSPTARGEVHELRGRVDAIVTGIGTLLADDPRLSVRPPGRSARPPRRVVLDTFLRTPPSARLFEPPREGEAAGPVHLLCAFGADVGRRRALEAAGAHVHAVRGTDRQHLDLWEVQTWLSEQGVERVLLESGPTLLQEYLERGLVDQVRVYSGSVRGGRGPSLGARLASLPMLERLDREIGEDAVIEAFLRPF